MSNSQKITQMPTATLPLSGSELVPIVQTGNNVSVSAFNLAAASGLAYQGLWNASTNNPTLTSSVGTRGYYYIVSTAGSTNLNGITTWNVGDWAIFSNTGVWQRIAGGIPASLSITNDTSSNTNYNLTLSSATSGYISTLNVDGGGLTFNPSTATLKTSAALIGPSNVGTVPLVISAETISGSNLLPTIGVTASDWLWIAAYDGVSPDFGIYNYSLFADGGAIGFYMSTVNTVYDKGVPTFLVNSNGAAQFGNASGVNSGFGTAGQVLASNGSSSSAYWANVGSLPSLREMKANIASVGDVNWINGLNPVSYNKRIQDDQGNYTDAVQPEKEFGLIAEEVEAVNPEMCYYKDGKLAGVNYLQFIAPLLKKVQDLEARLAAVEGK